MKKKNHLLLFCIVISLGNMIPSFSQIISDKYDFIPITSKGDWKYLSYTEKVQALQIPEGILEEMSTEALIETCLNYPLFSAISAFSNQISGFDQISAEFNGFQELFVRKDRGVEMSEKYKKMNPRQFDTTWTNLQQGQFAINFFHIELLLAQKEILESLSRDEILILLEESLSKHRMKKNLDMFRWFGITTPFLMGHILYYLNDENFLVKSSANTDYSRFINSLFIMNRSIIDEIEYLSENYLSREL